VATTPEAIDVVVIGGGQAGLATSHELWRAGVPHVVLERDRVGSSWAGLWDSFRLNTPNWSLRLPGMAYDGDEPDTFMARTEVIGHLERYSRTTPAEVREGVRVDSLVASDTGVLLATSAGPIETRAVVVCTGAYQRAFRPSGAEALPDDLAVVDTRSYRNPDALPDGAVLVVGSGQSGCQIAEELLEAGREVIVACGKAAWAPRRIGEHDVVWWALETGFFDQRPDDLPSPAARLAANVTVSGAGGGHDLDARILRSRGATLAGRFDGCDGARIRFADDLAASIAWGDDRYREFVHMASELCAARACPTRRCPSQSRSRPSRPPRSTSAASGRWSSRAGSAPTTPGSTCRGSATRWGSRRTTTAPAALCPASSSWGCISSARGSRRCSAAWARTPRSWRTASPRTSPVDRSPDYPTRAMRK
jgi:putative flavoprotein involved in K+ transport